MNICVQVFVWIYISFSLSKYLGVKWLDSMVSIFNTLEISKIVIQLYLQWQCMKVLVFPYLHLCLIS